jgi:hypothetical protein
MLEASKGEAEEKYNPRHCEPKQAEEPLPYEDNEP